MQIENREKGRVREKRRKIKGERVSPAGVGPANQSYSTFSTWHDCFLVFGWYWTWIFWI